LTDARELTNIGYLFLVLLVTNVNEDW